MCGVVVDSLLQKRHLEMLVHASPKHFGMVARLLKTSHHLHHTEFMLSVQLCLFFLILKESFFSFLVCLKPNLHSFFMCFLKILKGCWQLADSIFLWSYLRFLGRTDTVDFSTSFLDVSFESTSPSSQEDSSQSLLCGCFLGLWFFTLYNTLKTMPFKVRKTEIYFICSEAKLKGWPINTNKTIVTM